MDNQISSGLRITFLVHFILGLIFGLLYLTMPDFYGELIGWDVAEPIMHRMLGAALIGFSISSLLAFLNPYWNRVKITVIMEILWTSIAAVVMIAGMFTMDLPVMGWMNTILMIVFAKLFFFLYLKERRMRA